MGKVQRAFLSISIFSLMSGAAVKADPIIGPAPEPEQLVQQLEMNTRLLRALEDSIPPHRRRQMARRVDRVSQELAQIADEIDGGGGGIGFGSWLQADGQECTSFCRSRGMQSTLSPEGAQCTSGENQVNSAIGQIVYSYGTWGGVAPSVPATSSGRFCYKPGQKRDNDRTDITVGCFCQ